MKKLEIQTIVVDHQKRQEMGLSILQWMFLDLIYQYQNNPENKSGWCIYPVDNIINDFIGNLQHSSRDRTKFIDAIKALILKDLVEWEPATQRWRTTENWYKNAYKTA